MTPTAVVVGGTRRVGRWVSEALLAAGYGVHATYHSDAAAARLFEGDMAEAGYPLTVHQADALDAAALSRVIGGLDSLDVLVCCYGPSVFGLLSQTSGAELEAMFRGNVLSVHHAVQAALPRFGESGGRVVSFLTAAAETGRAFRDIAAYAAAKAMLHSYSRSLARELAGRSITVNCISLGVAGLMPEGVPPVSADRIPTGRHLNQEDVAAAIWYLTSPPASQVTGSVIDLAGGFGL